MPREPAPGHRDDFLPGVPPMVIGIGAGVLVWALGGLLVQGVAAVVWALVVAFAGEDPSPTWVRLVVGVVLQIGVIAAAVRAGRRATRWVAARRRDP